MNSRYTVARGRGSGAAVVIVPSAFGVAPDLVAQMEELASKASLVVALEPFPDDPGPVPYEDMARVMGRLQKLDRERLYDDLRGAIAWARGEGASSVVVLGICFGAPFAMRAAADGLANALATWHGTRMEDHLARAAEMRCPMRLHFGGVDPFVKPEAVEKVRAAFADRDDVRIVVHEGATHGFSHRAATAAYHEGAERAAMQSLRELV